MYLYIEMQVGRHFSTEKNKIIFRTKKYSSYKDVPLFNYTMTKKDLGEVIFHKFYNNNELRAFIVVPEEHEIEGTKALKEGVISSLLDVEKQLNEVIYLIQK